MKLRLTDFNGFKIAKGLVTIGSRLPRKNHHRRCERHTRRIDKWIKGMRKGGRLEWSDRNENEYR